MKTNKFRRVQVKNGDYGINLTLKDEIKTDLGGQIMYYTVQENTNQVVKLMNLSDENNYNLFQQEVFAWNRMKEEKPNIPIKQTKEGKYDQFPNIVDTKAAFRMILKDTEFGIFVMEHCPKGSLDSICIRLPSYALKEIQIMRIIRDILQGVQYLHMRQNPLIHRNLTMQNILLGEDNNYKITNFSYVTTHRIQNDDFASLQNEIKKNTTEGYRAPEQIHLQSGYPINEKVDIFAVGVILYILCFNKKPFQNQISVLNEQVDIPDFPKYSANVNTVLQRMLCRDPNQRANSSELLSFVLQAWPDLKILQSKTGLLDTDIFKQAAEKEVKPTMINKFKKMITLKLINKRTKGWILAALEENEKGPKQKYMRLLIIKAWQKTDKIEKFYDHFNMFLTPQNVQNTIIALKSLILLHNYIKKGPPEALSSVGKKVSAVNVLKKIIETWQNIDPSDDSKDKKRSVFTTKLINMYSQRLKEKMNLCVSYCSLIEGNFSLKPFFDNMNKNFKPLTHKLIEDLLKYMASLLAFSQEILSQNQLMEIQVSLMIQLVDEMYCLLSAQTHLLTAFITSTNYLSKNIDRGKLFAKVKDFKVNFGRNFESAKQFFRKCQNALSQSTQKDFIPNIDSKVVEYINNLPCMQDLQNEFNLFEFLNYKKSIYGIKLPLSYGATIQTNNNQSEEMKREMENVIKKPPTNQKLIVQLDDQKTTSNSNSNSQETKEKNYDFQKQFKKRNQLIRGEKNLLSDQDNDDYNMDEQQEGQGITDYTPTYKNPEQKIIQNHLVDTAQIMQMKQNQLSQSANLGNINDANKKNIPVRPSAPTIPNAKKNNIINQNSKRNSNNKGDYLMEDQDEFDEENPNIQNNNSDSDELEDTQTINDNNQNYNDILDQDDEQENFQLEFTHQSLNKQQYSQGEMNYEKMPSNIDKFKNMNFIDYNDMNNNLNNQNQNNFQNNNNMLASNPNMINSNPLSNNLGGVSNNFQDEFHDFNNFQNFGLKHSQSNILNVNNNTTNNSFQNKNFNDFNFNNFDNSTSGFVNNNNAYPINNTNNVNGNFGNITQNRKTSSNIPASQNNNNMAFSQPNNIQRNNNSAQKISPVQNNFVDFGQYNNNNNNNTPPNYQQNPNGQQSSAQKTGQNQYDFTFQNQNANNQQKTGNRVQIKFELKENKGGSMGNSQQFNNLPNHQPHSQSFHNGTNQQMHNQLQQKQQQGSFGNFQMNRVGSSNPSKSPNNYFEEFNFVNQNNQNLNNNANQNANNTYNFFNQGFNNQQQQQLQGVYGMNQQQQIQNKQQVNNFFNQQGQLGQNQKLNQSQFQQRTSQSFANNAEEFDVSEMVENNKAIEFTNAASIKRNDLNQLNQMSSQINATNNQVNNGNLMNKDPVLQSVSSTFSSNNENLIELKNFIINRVKHDPKQLIVDFHSITFGKKIGSGHSGKVFSGVFNSVEVAIKEMEVNNLNERNQKEFQREIETLVKISPQINLVSLIGVAQKKDNFYIITELCHGGTMFDLLHRKHSVPIPWLHRVKMCKDIATGMIYLHSLEPPIIHRDLKSLNLLLDVPYQEDSFDYHVKIADFGLARTESKDEMTQVLGTFHWMAPEVFDNKQYTIKADVYSYAIVLWEFISRKTPYQKMSTVDIMKNVCEGKRPGLGPEFIPKDCPPSLIDLMKDCWEQDPNKRPDFREVLERLEYIENDLQLIRNRASTNSRPAPPAVTTINKSMSQQPPKPQGTYSQPAINYPNQMAVNQNNQMTVNQPLSGRQLNNYQQVQQSQLQQQTNQYGGFAQQNMQQQQQNVQVYKQ
ncbi:tyrosine kinase domain protein (macronuclear) [Tetrahymena thermophila SB210]|uniref:Tyrosine kinase domain protein n=1 Tax=Tetrahymena thermophila (strain SB210) TaxID=312017 RepID=Q23AD7_TETTS|nr:tyrosine kinase domain protein [Tetrahymena thermophila SB210]EAR93555.2 tyrosine kinase domain protein [Tetrahymena thermophila SB210]|eukprot:XP_001013800.2 tyrosine kinase domain protein [Tetrahymena thermophila SB210]